MTAVTAGRAEDFAAALQERELEAEQLRGEVFALEVKLDTTLREEILRAPKQRPFKDLGTPASRVRKRLEEKRRALDSLEAELPILREQAAAIDRERAQATLAAAVKELRAIEARQPAAWQHMTDAYQAVLDLWKNEANGIVAERRDLRARVIEELSAHNDLIAAFQAAFDSPQVPELPSSLGGALRKLESEAFSDTAPVRSVRGDVERIYRDDPGWAPPGWKGGP